MKQSIVIQICNYYFIFKQLYEIIIYALSIINNTIMEFKDRLQHLFDITLINNKPITTYRVGKDTSITRVSLDNYLSGKQSPSIENATIIAQYFNVSTEWLLKGEGNKETDEDSSFISLSREVWNVIKKQADRSEERRVGKEC